MNNQKKTWQDFLEPLNHEFAKCDIDISESYGCRVDGSNGIIRYCNILDSQGEIPSSCDYFYLYIAENTTEEAFHCIEFSDLCLQQQEADRIVSDLKNANYRDTCERDNKKRACKKIEKRLSFQQEVTDEICKKIHSTGINILQYLYNDAFCLIAELPSWELQKYFFVVWNDTDLVGNDPVDKIRFFSNLEDKIRKDLRMYRIEPLDKENFFVLNLCKYKERYLK